MSDPVLAAPKPNHQSVNYLCIQNTRFPCLQRKNLDHEDQVKQVLGYKDSGKAVVKSGFEAVQVSRVVGISHVF